MSKKPSSTSQNKKEVWTLLGFLTVTGVIYAVLETITSNPAAAIFGTLIVAILASIWLYRNGVNPFNITLGWLLVIVLGIVVYVGFPKSATVDGYVYDDQNIPVKNAEVILIDSTGINRTVITKADGYYEFTDVKIGAYTVKVGDRVVGGKISNPLTPRDSTDIYVSALGSGLQPTSTITPMPVSQVATTLPSVTTTEQNQNSDDLVVATNTSTITPQPINTATPSTTSLPDTALIIYTNIYKEKGFCGLWEQLVQENGVSGVCPVPREMTSAVGDFELIDGFVLQTKEFIVNKGFVLSSVSDTTINYPHCVTLEPSNQNTNILKAPGIEDAVLEIPGTIRATDLIFSGNFTLYLRCDGESWLVGYP